MRNKRGLVALLAVVAMIGLWYVLLWSPTSKQLSSARGARAAAVQSEQALVDQKLALLAKVREIPMDEAKASALTQQLPSTADIPGLIDAISQAAASSKASLGNLSQSIATATTTGASAAATSTSSSSSAATATTTAGSASSTASSSAAPALGTVGVQLSVSGTYAQTTAFLDDLQGMQRFVSISGSGISGTSGALTVSITASAYFDTATLPKTPVVTPST